MFGGAPAVSRIEETPAPYAVGTGLILDGCAPAESESSGPTPVGSPRVPDGRQVNTVSEFTVRRSFQRLCQSPGLRLHPKAGRDSIFFCWMGKAPDLRGLEPNSPVGGNYRKGTGRIPASGTASPFLQFGGAPAVSHIEETPAPYAAGTGLTCVLSANQCSKNPGSSPPGSSRILLGAP